MALVITFITIVAWCGAIGGALLVALRLYGEHVHHNDKLQQAIDEIRNIRRSFPIAVPFWVCVISIIFLIAKAIS